MAFLAPIIGAIGSALTAGGIGAFALKLGGSLLLSAASSALMRRPSQATAQIGGGTVALREEAAPRQMVYGRGRVGGTIVYWASEADGVGTPNNIVTMVIVLATHQVRSIGAVYLNGELAYDAAGNTVARFVNSFAIEKYLGQPGIIPFPELRSMSGGKWTDAHRLQGCAAVAVRLGYNPNAYPSGLPNIAVDMEGCVEVLDPRSGLTGYSENPALCLAHYMAHPRFGLNAAIGAEEGIATAELIAAANVCDEGVPKVGGGFEPRYSMNGRVDLSREPKAIIEDMLTAMAGDVVPVAGQFRIYAGAWRPSSADLTDDDVVDGGFRMTTRISRADSFNGVRGKFVSPENDWAVDDFPAYSSSVYVAEDKGEQVWADIVLPYTISASMAQRLAKIHLERQRRQFTVTFATKLSAWRVAPMDTVTLTRPRWGFSAKPFEVRAMQLEIGQTIVPSFTLRETSPLIYDWNTSEAQIYAAAPRTTLPSAFDLPPPGGLSVSEALDASRPGSGVRAVATLVWQPAPNPFVALYDVAGRVNGGPWIEVGRVSETQFVWEDIAPGLWEFRVRARSTLGVVSGWLTVVREILGLTAPPVALTGAVLQSAGGLAIIEWGLHPDLDVRIGGQIVIRHSAGSSPAWANSVSMKTVPGSTALAVVPLKPGAYVLRAQDSTGQLGPETVLLASGAQVLPFLTGTTLQEDATFSGAKSGVIVDSGALRLDSAGDFDSIADFDAIPNFDAVGGVVPTGTYVFATTLNLGSVKAVRLRSVIVNTVLGVMDDFDQRPGNFDDWPFFDGVGGSEVDVVVECRTTQTNPGGSPVWSAWARMDSSEVQAWGVQARAVLTTSDAGFTPVVEQLRLIAQEAA